MVLTRVLHCNLALDSESFLDSGAANYIFFPWSQHFSIVPLLLFTQRSASLSVARTIMCSHIQLNCSFVPVSSRTHSTIRDSISPCWIPSLDSRDGTETGTLPQCSPNEFSFFTHTVCPSPGAPWPQVLLPIPALSGLSGEGPKLRSPLLPQSVQETTRAPVSAGCR